MIDHVTDAKRQKSSIEESLDSVFVDPERRPRIETKENLAKDLPGLSSGIVR